MRIAAVMIVMCGCLGCGAPLAAQPPPPADFINLFNGRDFTHWKVPEGDNGHWRVVDGVIDCDARSEAGGGNDGRSLWSVESFGDFVLKLDWRIKTEEPGLRHRVPIIEPDGSYRTDAAGRVAEVEIEDVDSGVYLRGTSKAQINIWMWPVGSGEIWAYRRDESMPAAVRAACTPRVRADKPRGQWNTFEITMRGDRVSVVLNGVTVIDDAHLPGVPRRGPIALQHHGSLDRKTGAWSASYGPGRWSGGPSLVQFRNIYIRPLE